MQVRVEAMVTVRVSNLDVTLKRGILETSDAATEINDTLTGRTTVSFKPKEIVVVASRVTNE